MFREDEYVALAALQHYVFCPRQCALIHTERVWEENALTTLGKIEHERVDLGRPSSRGACREERAVHLVCHQLGIKGKADVVEYEETPGGQRVTPVEYKHGRPKEHDADAVQLCAQALCLEEMHACDIPRGYLFYHTLRRRTEIEFSPELRATTLQAIKDTRTLLSEGTLPTVVRGKHCDACSLFPHCLPPPRAGGASAFNNRQFSSLLSDPEP